MARGRDAPDIEEDGRVLRGARNRDAILEALYALVSEGALRPTAEQVAERAGVGTRTVFRHFDDMETLHAEMNSRLRSEVEPRFTAPPVEGSLAERVRTLLERRAGLYERIAPFKRSGNLHRWRSPFLQREHAAMVRRLRRDLMQALPELEQAPEESVEALDLVTSFEAWDRLRTDQRLGRARAIQTIEAAVLALVEGGSG